jgi:hypothetical protein
MSTNAHSSATALRNYARRAVRVCLRIHVNPSPAQSVIPVTASAAWKGLRDVEETVIGWGFAGLGWPRMHPGNAGFRP